MTDPHPGPRRISRTVLVLTVVAAVALAGGGAAWAAARATDSPVVSTSPAPPDSPGAGLADTAPKANRPALIGTVTKLGSGVILITDPQGFQRTVRINSSTTYTRGGQPADSSAVKVGDRIVAKGKVDPNRTDLDASSVAVRLPSVAGKVTSVSGSSFQLVARDGSSHMVTTDSSTVFHQGPNQASLSAVTQGALVVAEGNPQSNGDLAATSVEVAPAGQPVPGHFGPPRMFGGSGGAPGGAPRLPAPGTAQAPAGTAQAPAGATPAT